MELLGVIFILIGLLALIASSIILIISVVKNQKSKLVSGLMLITSIVLMFVGAGILAMDEPTGKKQAQDKPKTDDAEIETVKKDEIEDEVVPVTSEVDETSSIDAEREYYRNEIAPVTDKLMLEFDDVWSNHWQVPFDKLGRSEIGLDEVKQNLATLDDKYYDLREILDPLTPTSLSEANAAEFEQYKVKFMAAITARMFVADNTIKAIDEGTLNDNHVKSSLTMIEIADEDLLAAIAHWTVIKQRLD